MTAVICKSSDFAPETIEARNVEGLGLASLPRRLIAVLYTWQRRSDDRRRLVNMSNQMLADIGLDREDVMREAAKPFWKS